MPGPKETNEISAKGFNALMKRYSEVQLATLVDTPPRAFNGSMKLSSMAIGFWRMYSVAYHGSSPAMARTGQISFRHCRRLSRNCR